MIDSCKETIVHKIVLVSNVLKEAEYEEWELSWADVLAHAALLLIKDVSVTQADELAQDVLDISHMLESLKKAQSMLKDAIRVFRKTISNVTGDDQVFYQLQLATCLQNMGTTIMMTSTVSHATIVLEESRTIFQFVSVMIGAIQLSNSQVELAMTSFVKAIDLYKTHNGEERAIADVKLNMGMALFCFREFDESAWIHGEALELFRETVGEGKNPLVDGAAVVTDSGDASVNIENEDNAVRSHLVNLNDFRQSLANVTLDERRSQCPSPRLYQLPSPRRCQCPSPRR